MEYTIVIKDVVEDFRNFITFEFESSVPARGERETEKRKREDFIRISFAVKELDRTFTTELACVPNQNFPSKQMIRSRCEEVLMKTLREEKLAKDYRRSLAELKSDEWKVRET